MTKLVNSPAEQPMTCL